MSYRLEQGEYLSCGIKRVAKEQLEKAIHELENPGDDIDEAIHDARKRFKKARAVIRLVRDEVGKDRYKQENTCFRDAGRKLAPARDSVVRIETLDDLQKQFAEQLQSDAFEDIQEKLKQKYEYVMQKIIKDGAAVVDTIEMIKYAKQRVNEWEIDNEDFSAFYDGLKRVYKRGRKAMKKAYNEKNGENFHEWRKRVKYLWYHVRILRNSWKEILSPFEDYIHDLADYLGNDHDLVELRAEILNNELVDDYKELEHLLALIKRRQHELRFAAWELGARIYAESPSDFCDRMSEYFYIWKSD